SYLETNHLPMTAGNLGFAYNNLQPAGALQVSPHVLRRVLENKRIRLARWAEYDPQTAFSGYLHLRVPKAVADQMETEEDYYVVEAFLCEPANQEIFKEALIQIRLWNHTD